MSTSNDLPRRALLGLGLHEEDGALRVTRVVAGSIAESVGLRPGDVLETIDDDPVETIERAQQIVGRRRTVIRVVFSREGRQLERQVRATPYPLESIPGSRVHLAYVVVNGARLRTIQTIPETPGPHPAVLFLSGLRCESIDLALSPDAPVARVVRGLARAGFSTMRVERHGLGDSEGPPCRKVGFLDEQAAYRAGLTALRRHPEVDVDRLFVYGHSVGGMHAALLAEAEPLAGVVLYGSSARRWSECLRDGMRRQMSLQEVAESQIERALREFDEHFPDDRYGRCARFHRELDAVDLAAAWRRARTELLVLIGEYDWVVGADEPRELAALVPGSTVVELAGLDHAFTRHASRQASLQNYARGPWDERPIAVAARWMQDVGPMSRR